MITSTAEKVRHQAELAQSTEGTSPEEIVLREMITNSFRGRTYASFYNSELGCAESELGSVAKNLEVEGFYTRIEYDGYVGDQLEVSAYPFED